MKRKQEACDVVMKHIAWLLAQDHKIEMFGSDQGRELANNTWKMFLRSRVILLLITSAYSHEENGLVEHMNGLVLSRIRSLLTTVNMPSLLWGRHLRLLWSCYTLVQLAH